ncbi:hypothetical protein LXA47_15085 [Massilia sp. P8910]|uniref:hypothetical protein n=1 Tax=Massilia antarctica TaxID=2765360 RepID=UPI001E4005D7|nr:hypothetical protein [Massilia antarctica]MCE3604926.1 hypothetical protein [Massilia antarctica]
MDGRLTLRETHLDTYLRTLATKADLEQLRFEIKMMKLKAVAVAMIVGMILVLVATDIYVGIAIDELSERLYGAHKSVVSAPGREVPCVLPPAQR